MTETFRDKPWQFTWAEFLGEATEREGGTVCVRSEVEFHVLDDAAALLRRIMGDAFERVETVASLAAPDGRRARVCLPDADGVRLFAAMVDDPDIDAAAARLAWDEDFEGPHYLTLRHPPLVVLLDREGRSPELAGWFCGTILRIDGSVRGLGLGRVMVMEAAVRRGGRPLEDKGSGFSEAGYATMRAAHRELVRKAVLDGESVSEEVTADHPELRRDSVPGW